MVPRAHLDVLEEKNVSRSSEIEPRFVSGHARSRLAVRTAAVPFLKMGWRGNAYQISLDVTACVLFGCVCVCVYV